MKSGLEDDATVHIMPARSATPRISGELLDDRRQADAAVRRTLRLRR
jgi:hypothetical protein